MLKKLTLDLSRKESSQHFQSGKDTGSKTNSQTGLSPSLELNISIDKIPSV